MAERTYAKIRQILGSLDIGDILIIPEEHDVEFSIAQYVREMNAKGIKRSFKSEILEGKRRIERIR